MDPVTIFTTILEFVKSRQNQDAAKDLEQIKQLTAEAVAFTQSTTPDYAKVSPFVNSFVAITRPTLTWMVVIGHFLAPDRVPTPWLAIPLSWFVSRGFEKVATAWGGNGNGSGGQQSRANATNGH